MDDIDLAGVVDNLQHENEQLRMKLFKAYHSRSLPDFVDFVDLSAIGSYLYENATTIAAAASIVVAVLYCISWIVETLRSLRKK